jgi:hypothetical protein
VVKAGTNERPGKYIRLFHRDGEGHINDYCFTPNGYFFPSHNYDKLSREKMVEENKKTNQNELQTSKIDGATNPVQPLKTSHSIHLQQTANPPKKEHAETSTSISEVSFPHLAQVFGQL